jgi:hypothetical protein
MNESEFWLLIELFEFSWDTLSGDESKVMRKALKQLSTRSAVEIMQFDDLLAEKLHALDTREHASNMGAYSYSEEEHFSPDFFLYARCSVVANGKDFYENVLNDPSNMVKGLSFEPLLYLCQNAYQIKTNETYDHCPETDIETYSNSVGWG